MDNATRSHGASFAGISVANSAELNLPAGFRRRLVGGFGVCAGFGEPACDEDWFLGGPGSKARFLRNDDTFHRDDYRLSRAADSSRNIWPQIDAGDLFRFDGRLHLSGLRLCFLPRNAR